MKRGMALYKREKEETHWFLLLSFLIPALLYGSGLVVQQVHPFGTRQILVVDFWHQYAPVPCSSLGTAEWAPIFWQFMLTMQPVR